MVSRLPMSHLRVWAIALQTAWHIQVPYLYSGSSGKPQMMYFKFAPLNRHSAELYRMDNNYDHYFNGFYTNYKYTRNYEIRVDTYSAWCWVQLCWVSSSCISTLPLEPYAIPNQLTKPL